MTRSEEEISRIIEMAWEDRTPFEAIEQQFNLNEGQVITLMRSQTKPAASECGASASVAERASI